MGKKMQNSGQKEISQKEKSRAVQSETSDTDAESVGRVKKTFSLPDEVMKVNNSKKDISEKSKIKLNIMNHKDKSEEIEVEFLVDNLVNKTLLSEN